MTRRTLLPHLFLLLHGCGCSSYVLSNVDEVSELIQRFIVHNVAHSIHILHEYCKDCCGCVTSCHTLFSSGRCLFHGQSVSNNHSLTIGERRQETAKCFWRKCRRRFVVITFSLLLLGDRNSFDHRNRNSSEPIL